MLFAESGGKIKKLFVNQQAWHNKFFIVNFFISFTFVLLAWGEIIWTRFAIGVPEDFLSLHYSIYFGVDWLGNYWDFSIFGIFASVVFIVNLILTNLSFSKNKIIAYFYIGTTTITASFMLAATSLAVYINLK
jgi:hypothetical protein